MHIGWHTKWTDWSLTGTNSQCLAINAIKTFQAFYQILLHKTNDFDACFDRRHVNRASASKRYPLPSPTSDNLIIILMYIYLTITGFHLKVIEIFCTLSIFILCMQAWLITRLEITICRSRQCITRVAQGGSVKEEVTQRREKDETLQMLTLVRNCHHHHLCKPHSCQQRLESYYFLRKHGVTFRVS